MSQKITIELHRAMLKRKTERKIKKYPRRELLLAEEQEKEKQGIVDQEMGEVELDQGRRENKLIRKIQLKMRMAPKWI